MQLAELPQLGRKTGKNGNFFGEKHSPEGSDSCSDLAGAVAGFPLQPHVPVEYWLLGTFSLLDE